MKRRHTGSDSAAAFAQQTPRTNDGQEEIRKQRQQTLGDDLADQARR